jgi:hypothetical protein
MVEQVGEASSMEAGKRDIVIVETVNTTKLELTA